MQRRMPWHARPKDPNVDAMTRAIKRPSKRCQACNWHARPKDPNVDAMTRAIKRPSKRCQSCTVTVSTDDFISKRNAAAEVRDKTAILRRSLGCKRKNMQQSDKIAACIIAAWK